MSFGPADPESKPPWMLPPGGDLAFFRSTYLRFRQALAARPRVIQDNAFCFLCMMPVREGQPFGHRSDGSAEGMYHQACYPTSPAQERQAMRIFCDYVEWKQTVGAQWEHN